MDLIKSSLSLQVLNLNGNNLGDSFGVPLGAAFEKNYFITTLDLSNTKIGEPTAKSLSEVLWLFFV